MTSSLGDETKTALDALIPLVLDDGALHLTATMPRSVYETPLHLDYVAQRLPVGHAKRERLLSIDRVVRLEVPPLAKLCRFRDRTYSASPTMMWWARQVDPHTRFSFGSIEWAPTLDEYEIKTRFNALIRACIRKTRGMAWCGGVNSDTHQGRFRPVPRTEAALRAIFDDLEHNLAHEGFRLEISILDQRKRKR